MMEEIFEIDDCEIIHETDKAVLVLAPHLFDEETWIPISQVHDDSEIWEKGDSGTLLVKEWYAREKGWI